jgi:hypothetical protein
MAIAGSCQEHGWRQNQAPLRTKNSTPHLTPRPASLNRRRSKVRDSSPNQARDVLRSRGLDDEEITRLADEYIAPGYRGDRGWVHPLGKQTAWLTRVIRTVYESPATRSCDGARAGTDPPQWRVRPRKSATPVEGAREPQRSPLCQSSSPTV